MFADQSVMPSRSEPCPDVPGWQPDRFVGQLFPFHLRIDHRGRVVGFGRSAGKLFPRIAQGADLGDIANCIRPDVSGCLGNLWGLTDSIILLQSRASGTRWRGQGVIAPGGESMFLVGSPWFDSPEVFGAAGLRLADFALHDPSFDLVLLAQAHARSAAEIRRLADRIRFQAIETSRERAILETGFSTLGVGVISFNSRLEVTFINEVASSLLSCPQIAAMHAPVRAVLSRLEPAHRSELDEILRRPRPEWHFGAIHRGVPRMNVRDSLDNQRPVAIQIIPLEEASAESGLILIRDIAHDIDLEDRSRRFASGLSHELRTPLTALAGFAQILHERDILSTADRQEFSKIMLEQIGRMQRIVSRILQLAHAGSGVDRRRAEVGINQLKDLLLASIGALAESHGVQVEVHLAPDTPDYPGDIDKLQSILVNLAENSIRACTGAAAGRVCVSLSCSGDFLSISVIDNGRGIPARIRDRIFDEFFRGPESDGSGLGLPLVKSIVESYGGSIEISPNPDGVGTRAEVRLPY